MSESLLMDTRRTISKQLLKLRDSGIQVAIDGFGTGYSSLSFIKKFAIDYIKIDQSFVRNLDSQAGDLPLCEAIIAMAHKLNIKVIAEGIETEQQRRILSVAGCDYGQGFLFSRPLPVYDFGSLLVHNHLKQNTVNAGYAL
ncbi:EAL domain-containing protein [Methylocucumis oryzae]|uniref:EAL domain-containing protein n=1 Tax=Methylocucumis oryzae TaxID=1632867 RepID=UPI0023BAB915|nr:EAL domain-containing protein [Methylocucumis oryzae]